MALQVVSWSRRVMPALASALAAGLPMAGGKSVPSGVPGSLIGPFLHGRGRGFGATASWPGPGGPRLAGCRQQVQGKAAHVQAFGHEGVQFR